MGFTIGDKWMISSDDDDISMTLEDTWDDSTDLEGPRPDDDDYIREALESLSNDFEEVHCSLPDVDPDSLFEEVENLGIF